MDIVGCEEAGRRLLGERIRAQRDAIISAWEAAVRQLPAAARVSAPLLRVEMPAVIESIAARVDAPLERSRSTPAQAPERHAMQRLGLGYELTQLLLEYSVLRNCILRAIGSELILDELMVLNDAVDSVANRSVEHFTEASERVLKALDLISAAALHSHKLDELLNRVLRVMMQSSPAVDSVAILLLEDGRLRMGAAAGLIAERDPSFSLRVGEGFSGTIAATGIPKLSRSAANDPLVKSDFIKLRGIQALYGVPLVGNDVVGVAHMGSLTVNDFTHEEKLLFQAMATRATVAIVRAQLLQQIESEHNLLVSSIRQMPIGVVIRAADGALLAANEAAERLFREQVPPSLEAAEHAPWTLVDREGRAVAFGEWPLTRALAGEEVRREEVTLHWRDGSSRAMEVSAAPIRDPRGRVLAAVTISEDVTERRQAEQERELFISTLSHDLRTPLSVIRFGAEALLRKISDAAQVKTLGRVVGNVERMDRMIQQLLDFARSRHGGGFPIARREVDLVALCKQMIDSLESTDAPNDRAAPRVQLSAPGELVGNWDPDRLSQLLQNLIGNALEHGRAGDLVEVSVSADARVARLSVSNHPERPIPPALLPRLFDPFRRGSERGGLGLGLYICQQIARAHGCQIEVESTPQRTCFALELPRDLSV